MPPTQITITVPSLADIGQFFVNALGRLDHLAVGHHVVFFIASAALFFNPVVFTWPLWPFKQLYRLFVRLIGFREEGIRLNSYAVGYQSTYYSGYIPRNSYFAELQSYGAISEDDEDQIPLYARVLGWIAGILAARSLFL
ncbi:hypothetical protein D9758_006353 [Tetrapyrgos nigripes]|uniref:Uncharacterized protein n=1 Tax=Tetrapyrgos nigripes TaxID=182062 RepID=A0A8H5D8E9_9AGAR|nr:hypothetical protein D9758_006353 [Tetrapyrgos nigripes]